MQLSFSEDSLCLKTIRPSFRRATIGRRKYIIGRTSRLTTSNAPRLVNTMLCQFCEIQMEEQMDPEGTFWECPKCFYSWDIQSSMGEYVE